MSSTEIKENNSQVFITVEKAKDTGMAIVLICIIIHFAFQFKFAIHLAALFLIVNMTFPTIYKPLAVLWFALSNFLGTVVSKIILSVIFYFVVTPVGLTRRLMGKDVLKLKEFKKSKESSMRDRNHTYSSDDIIDPY